jgi:hypothetical protein
MKSKDPKDNELKSPPTDKKKDQPVPVVGEAVVTHQEVAAPQPPEKSIHPRRPLPPVPPPAEEG